LGKRRIDPEGENVIVSGDPSGLETRKEEEAKREREREIAKAHLIIPTAATYSCGSARVYTAVTLWSRRCGAGRDLSLSLSQPT